MGKFALGGGHQNDWKAERERIDLAAVATGLLGPAPVRQGRRLLWRCPMGTHEDRNPSFSVEPGKPWFKCWSCGESGDAATLVMKVQGVSFPQARAYLTGGAAPSGKPDRPKIAPRPSNRPEPEGMTPEAAATLVAESAARLFSPEGKDALAYLTGPERCLAPETIRAARLGWSNRIEARTRDGRPYVARGIVIPWWNGPNLTLVKIRQPDGAKPKYAQVFFDRTRHAGIYPGPEAIHPGRPLVVPEGEFDRMALGELASVISVGSASARPDAAALGPMLAAPRWYIATDADEAGEKSAAGWPARARRVRPPASFKDWTEAKAAGVDLARWWSDILAGNPSPPLFTSDELSRQRWGPSIDDPMPGIEVSKR